jgi:hypothetical protein
MSFGIPTRNGLPLGLGTVASLASRATAAVVSATDTFWKYVTLLLNTSATNGAQNNTFLDSSTNNFTVTRNGDTTQGSFNPYMPSGYWSGYFDGTDDYLTPTSTAIADFGTSDFTVECWVNLSSLGVTRCVMDSRSAAVDNQMLFQIETDNKAKFGAIVSGSVVYFVASTSTVVAGAWAHIAITRQGTTMRMFFNGALEDTQTNSTNFTQGTNRPAIGATGFTLGQNDFAGYISNLRVVKGTAVYTAAFTPPTTPLTAITNTSLLCLQDNRFIDNSTNAFAITVNGDTRISKFAPFNPPASYSTASYGGSGYFDGTGDYLSATSNAAFSMGTGTYTVELWVYLTATQATGVFFQVAGGLQFSTNNSNNIAIAEQGVAFDLSSTTTVPLNQWVHLAASRDSGNTTRIFLNGSEIASGTVTKNYAQGAAYINYNVAATTVHHTGYYSNLRIVKGTAVYTANFTPPTTPLTAITNTSLLLNFTNAGIFDAATINDGQTVGNAQVSTTQAKWSPTSMYFDGTGDYLTVIDKPELRFGTAPFTIEFWLYFTSSGGGTQTVVSKGTSTTGWQVQVSSAEQIEFVFGNLTITSATITPSVWTHVAVVREGTGTNQTKIYVNGTNTGVDTVATNFNQTNPLYVGASRILTELLYLGYVQDLRITNGVARYTANFTAPTAAFPTL